MSASQETKMTAGGFSLTAWPIDCVSFGVTAFITTCILVQIMSHSANHSTHTTVL